ncbi:MAG: DEAD/DEAH box helicase [Aminipila sp.]
MNNINEPIEKKIEKFKDYPLDNDIKRALSELGFKKPLEVQEKVIPMILEDKDLIVKSQTGSGKTAAFGIPLCEKVDIELEKAQVLILTPTRELTEQVKEDIEDIGKYKGVKCCALYGKELIQIQRKALKENPHIIVATPGRLMDHLLNKNIRFSELKYLVIDEADEMLMMGFKEQIDYIVSKIPKKRVTLLFSATMSDEVKILGEQYMFYPESIEIEAKEANIDKIEQIYYAVDGLKKVDFMKKAIEKENPRKAIIFCNTQEQVGNLYDILKKWNKSTCAVHGGMEQKDRKETLNAFKRGEYKLLIATDVAARGLHVQGITHVINYGVPFDNEQYVHRIGRTGRVDQHGIAITLVIPREMERFKALEEFLGYSIPCKGGHVQRKPKEDNKRRTGRERYKGDGRKRQTSIVQFNIGRSNIGLKASDFLYAIKSIPGMANEDVGKIEMRERTTNVEIFNDKDETVLRAFKTKKIKGKNCRVKRT